MFPFSIETTLINIFMSDRDTERQTDKHSDRQN